MRLSMAKAVKTLKADAKKGVTLVVVICVSAFLVAFALGMIYTAGMLLSGADKRLEQERCYQLARSFAQVLDRELTGYTKPNDTGTPQDSFYVFACMFLEDSRYMNYNPDHPDETMYRYNAGLSGFGQEGEEYGDIQVILYKELIEDDMTGEIDFDPTDSAREDPMETLTGQKIFRYMLTVEVVASLRGRFYHYRTVYDQRVRYMEDAITCRTPDGQATITWNKTDQKWYRLGGELYEPSGAVRIPYVIQPGFDKLDECEFRKTVEEVSVK